MYESRILEIITEIEIGLERTVEEAGLLIEAGAKSRARVSTGYMRAQIRWVPIDTFSGVVIGGADYTAYNEYGTVYMSAQPMFAPAAEEVRPIFIDRVKSILAKAVL